MANTVEDVPRIEEDPEQRPRGKPAVGDFVKKDLAPTLVPGSPVGRKGSRRGDCPKTPENASRRVFVTPSPIPKSITTQVEEKRRAVKVVAARVIPEDGVVDDASADHVLAPKGELPGSPTPQVANDEGVNADPSDSNNAESGREEEGSGVAERLPQSPRPSKERSAPDSLPPKTPSRRTTPRHVRSLRSGKRTSARGSNLFAANDESQGANPSADEGSSTAQVSADEGADPPDSNSSESEREEEGPGGAKQLPQSPRPSKGRSAPGSLPPKTPSRRKTPNHVRSLRSGKRSSARGSNLFAANDESQGTSQSSDEGSSAAQVSADEGGGDSLEDKSAESEREEGSGEDKPKVSPTTNPTQGEKPHDLRSLCSGEDPSEKTSKLLPLPKKEGDSQGRDDAQDEGSSAAVKVAPDDEGVFEKPAAIPRSPERLSARKTPRPRRPARRKTPQHVREFRLGKDTEEEEPSTPSRKKDKSSQRLGLEIDLAQESPLKRARGRRTFGSPGKDRISVPQSVSRVYGLVQKATGSIGGNGSDGAIYGELTVGCMQKVVNVLKEETGFNENSSFIDVGSGLGKPNFHVAQDPGCEISYGLELEEIRWKLSVVNHRRVLLDKGSDGVDVKKHNLFFAHGDVLSAKTFDPFTHIYMFDIGFPPSTLLQIAKIFNASKAPHLISYQKPHKVIGEYGFKVDKILQLPLSLTVSHEGHMMYLYRRKEVPAGLPVKRINEVDPFFETGVSLCRRENVGDGSKLEGYVEARFREHMSGGVRTRRAARAAARA